MAVRKGEDIVPHLRNLEEFLVSGLKYVFVPEQGELTRGIPTSHAAARQAVCRVARTAAGVAASQRLGARHVILALVFAAAACGAERCQVL